MRDFYKHYDWIFTKTNNATVMWLLDENNKWIRAQVEWLYKYEDNNKEWMCYSYNGELASAEIDELIQDSETHKMSNLELLVRIGTEEYNELKTLDLKEKENE